MRPGAGAFTTPGQMPAAGPQEAVPSSVPSASDPAAFLEQLKGLGLLGNVPQGVPSAKTPPAPMSGPMSGPMPSPMPAPSLGGNSVLSDPHLQPPRPQRKATFEPGKPGQARSGMTAHQMMRDPDVVRTLHQKIAAWEAENPNRALMGSHIQQMLPEVSASQARTIKRMLDKARVSQVTSSLEGLMKQGAAKAMEGER